MDRQGNANKSNLGIIKNKSTNKEKGRPAMKIRIDLPHHPYDIQIEKGCLSQAGKWLHELWQPQKIVIITDNRVASLYAEKVKLSLEDAGFQVAVFDFLEGEERKNLTTVQKVYEFLVKQDMTRSDGIVALGGGVVGDFGWFCGFNLHARSSFRSNSN